MPAKNAISVYYATIALTRKQKGDQVLENIWSILPNRLMIIDTWGIDNLLSSLLQNSLTRDYDLKVSTQEL